jgi:hypothetical protein
LYPGATARPLETLAASERPAALVILDGTWHTARALFRDHAWLQTLPRYSLAPPEPSRYRIRREPSLDCVSTIEAIVYALRQLEPSLEGTEGLLQAFEHLIDVQIRESSQRGHACRPRTRRPAEVRKLPRALVENFEGLVLVYGEAARPEHDLEAAPELVHWTALRLGDGATFDRVIRKASPSEPRLLQLGLCPGDFERGVGLGELSREFESFVGPEAWIAAWNPRTLVHFERAFGRPLAGVGLKGVYGRLRERHGNLDRILDFETPGMLPDRWALALAGVRGRARTRLANSLRVALFLRGLAQN